MDNENLNPFLESQQEKFLMTNDEIREMVEQKDYSDSRKQIQGMTQHELQILYYWGFRSKKYIFCSAAVGLLKEHYGSTPNYELCSERMSEYT
jgi:hypothetical protein